MPCHLKESRGGGPLLEALQSFRTLSVALRLSARIVSKKGWVFPASKTYARVPDTACDDHGKLGEQDEDAEEAAEPRYPSRRRGSDAAAVQLRSNCPGLLW